MPYNDITIIIAIWGSIVGTVSLSWQIYKFYVQRKKLKIKCGISGVCFVCKCLNESDMPINLLSSGAEIDYSPFYSKSITFEKPKEFYNRLESFFLKINKNDLICYDPMYLYNKQRRKEWNFIDKFPYVLKPGEYISLLIPTFFANKTLKADRLKDIPGMETHNSISDGFFLSTQISRKFTHKIKMKLSLEGIKYSLLQRQTKIPKSYKDKGGHDSSYFEKLKTIEKKLDKLWKSKPKKGDKIYISFWFRGVTNNKYWSNRISYRY